MVRILFLLWLAFWVSSCKTSTPSQPEVPPKAAPAPKAPSEKAPKPQESFKNLEYVHYRGDQPLWRLEAQKAQRYSDRIEMEGLRVSSLEQKGFSLKAQRGIYRPQKEVFLFQKEVVLTTPSKGTLFTEILYYFPQQKVLKNRAPLLLKDRGLVIQGVGFEYHLPSGKMRIYKKSQVKFHG